MGHPAVIARYEEIMERRPKLHEPVSFNEKIIWLKLHDRNPLLPVVTNKVSAREWIAQRVGHDILVPLVGIYESTASLSRKDLPGQFIAKLSTGTARNIIVRDNEALDWQTFLSDFDKWMLESQAYKLMEWYHHQTPPRILVEHLMLEPDGQVPGDYKFFVFDGHVEFVYHVEGRYSDQTRTCYRLNWQVMPVNLEGYPNHPAPPPPELSRMIEVAETLGSGFPFMRIDTYCHKGRVYVGEMTPHPNSGMCRFTPRSFDVELGNLLDLGRYRDRYWEKKIV